MPEGHSLRRLALAFEQWFVGSKCETSSPQGRFAAGAARLDGLTMTGAHSVGKHLFLQFEDPDDPSQAPLWLHTHLGLYGSWRFYGAPGETVPSSIGAPRLPDLAGGEGRGISVTSSNGEVADLEQTGDAPRAEEGDSGGDAFEMVKVAAAVDARSNEGVRLDADFGVFEDDWQPPPPRGAVRLRIVTDTTAADLTGPNQCQVLDELQVEEVVRRLGPDPLDHDTPPDELRQEFIDKIRASQRTIGELVMDQSIAAGVGNIYRAEALFRQGISPHRRGSNVSAKRVGRLWDDFVVLLADGVQQGRIRTVDPELVSPEVTPLDPESKKWHVYKRAGQPCLQCGAPVRTQVVQGRNLFWCSSCQR